MRCSSLGGWCGRVARSALFASALTFACSAPNSGGDPQGAARGGSAGQGVGGRLGASGAPLSSGGNGDATGGGAFSSAGGGAGSGGNGGASGASTNATCSRVKSEYAAELEKQLACNPSAGSQCTNKVAAAPG